ncbi:polypeptide N-acetylgalactosaminyltransferase 13-like [Anneissia japonica]|uniref:polypeptide N-acetylgalactosaminyltransferase 13-like n=1 Tax=Anneissia japonica TaxID=1529436 RepID=UPI00142571A6|nr:polypeptide N-acetylgalactosaminyltransferase 13-like [Anneissia japonica]
MAKWRPFSVLIWGIVWFSLVSFIYFVFYDNSIGSSNNQSESVEVKHAVDKSFDKQRLSSIDNAVKPAQPINIVGESHNKKAVQQNNEDPGPQKVAGNYVNKFNPDEKAHIFHETDKTNDGEVLKSPDRNDAVLKKSREIRLRGGNVRLGPPDGLGRHNLDPKNALPLHNGLHRARTGPGEDGRPVHLTGKEKQKSIADAKLHGFSLIVSNLISVERTVKDTREPMCRSMHYKPPLPPVSVIVVVHNIVWSVLSRLLHGIVSRTPDQLLFEILLVDDYSDNAEFLKHLKDLPDKLKPKVNVLRMKVRHGQNKARMEGVRAAKGDVVVFLDPYCEVGVKWLEPLLNRLNYNNTIIATPVIDRVDTETFEQFRSQPVRGGFKWNLDMRWMMLGLDEIKARQKDTTVPYITAVIMETTFAVHKKFFEHIGMFDAGMDGWGAENIELSFRTWMCGGSIEVVPCSRIFHLFRGVQQYSYPNGMQEGFIRNSMRTAELWMDGFKVKFLSTVPKSILDKSYGSLAVRQALKKGLKCKNFDWYLKTVYPYPLLSSNTMKAFGQVFNQETGLGLCLDTYSHTAGSSLYLNTCDRASLTQVFSVSSRGELKWNNICIEVPVSKYRSGVQPRLAECSRSGSHQSWIHSEPGWLLHKGSGLCMSFVKGSSPVLAVMNTCVESATQKWKFSLYHEI